MEIWDLDKFEEAHGHNEVQGKSTSLFENWSLQNVNVFDPSVSERGKERRRGWTNSTFPSLYL